MRFISMIERYDGAVVHVQHEKNYRREDLISEIDETCAKYRTGGIEEGEVVAIVGSSNFMYLIHFFALQQYGAIPLLLPHQTQPWEWLQLQRKHRLRSLITDCWDAKARQQLTLDEPGWRSTTLSQGNPQVLLMQSPCESKVLDISDVYIQPTSGSTGEAKLCVRSSQGAYMEALQIGRALDLLGGGNLLCPLPFYHAFGFGSALIMSLITSSRLYFMDAYHPRLLLKSLERISFDLLTAVPPMLELMLKVPSAANSRPAKILSAGSPLDEGLYDRFRTTYGHRIHSAYGTTETGKISIDLEEGTFLRGQVGRPLQGNRVKVDEANQELRVSTLSMMEGYLLPDGRLQQGVDEEGYFATGDLVRIDRSDRIVIEGRLKHLINVFGVKVNPLEVSVVLKEMEAVVDAHVYAGKHRNGSDLVFAAVAVSKDTTEAELLDFCRKRLNPRKIPTKIFLVDQVPRTPTGKIMPSALPIE